MEKDSRNPYSRRVIYSINQLLSLRKSSSSKRILLFGFTLLICATLLGRFLSSDDLVSTLIEYGLWISAIILTSYLSRSIKLSTIGDHPSVDKDRRATQARHAALSELDELTGLPNRILAMEHLSNFIQESIENDKELTVVMLGINRFAYINDSLGQGGGDTYLVEISKRLKDSLNPSQFLARMGGDIFLILAQGQGSTSSVNTLIESIQQHIEPLLTIANHPVRPSVSLGIAQYSRDGDSVDSLLQHAEQAMHRAKKGRDFFSFYDTEMDLLSRKKLRIEAELWKAIENGELSLNWQPIVRLSDGSLIGAEALLRWNNPALGSVAPDIFVPVAEETGLILPINNWVIERACREAASWSEHGLGNLRLAVNISSLQFASGNIVATVQNALSMTNLNPERLELEITESCLLQNSRRTLQAIRQLKSKQIRLSLDDFGTGFSSLSYLQKFEFDTLKIDRSFVQSLQSNPEGVGLVKAIINMCHSLHLDTIAEGIESNDQLDFLSSNQCTMGQGYYFSKPVTNPEFIAWAKDYLQHRSLAPGKTIEV